MTTRTFGPDEPCINSDSAFGVKESVLAEFEKKVDWQRSAALGFDGPHWEVEFDIVPALA